MDLISCNTRFSETSYISNVSLEHKDISVNPPPSYWAILIRVIVFCVIIMG